MMTPDLLIPAAKESMKSSGESKGSAQEPQQQESQQQELEKQHPPQQHLSCRITQKPQRQEPQHCAPHPPQHSHAPRRGTSSTHQQQDRNTEGRYSDSPKWPNRGAQAKEPSGTAARPAWPVKPEADKADEGKAVQAAQGTLAPSIAPQDRLLAEKQICRLYGFSRASRYRWTKLGKFPPPVLFGGRNRWWESQILAWRANLRHRDT
jgi:predicted DNA-binding transcriptional regulator AlpA